MGVMRLAIKYEIESLRATVVRVMEDSWPVTFSEWRQYRAYVESLVDEMNRKDEDLVDGRYLDDVLPEPASAIRLARDFGIPSILPYAFSVLSMRNAQMEWDEVRANNPDLLVLGRSTARWPMLHVEEYRILLHGKDVLAVRGGNLVTALQKSDQLAKTIHICPRTSCRTDLDRIVNGWKTRYFGHSLDPNRHSPSHPLRLLIELFDTRSDWELCKDCAKELEKHLVALQKIEWDALEGVFKLT